MDQISTERLYLKLVTSEDFPFIFKLVNSEGWITFIGDRKVDSHEAAMRYIEKISAIPDFFYWVIREKDSHGPVGIVSFIKRDYLPHFDVGFAILPGYHRRGYAFEATAQVITEYKRRGHKHILATVLPENSKSIRLLQKLGFAYENDMVVDGQVLQVFGLIGG